MPRLWTSSFSSLFEVYSSMQGKGGTEAGEAGEAGTEATERTERTEATETSALVQPNRAQVSVARVDGVETDGGPQKRTSTTLFVVPHL